MGPACPVTGKIPVMPIESKLPDIGTTIFTVMSQMAAEHNAINLSQGYPDFNAPSELLDLVSKAMQDGFNQYAPMTGIPALRNAISEKTSRIYNASIDPEAEVTIVSGATEGLFNAISVVINPGDEAIIFDPAYDSYEPVIRLNGGKTVRVSMNYPDYSIDWGRVREQITDRTRLIMLNSPHNPTGMVLNQGDIDQLMDIAGNNDIYIISDEVYEHIIFDGLQHLSMLRYPELRKKSFVVSSFGKTYHATGWKLGYCIAPDNLSVEYRKIHQFNTFTSSTPMQVALAKFITDRPDHYLDLPDFYQTKRDHLRRAMSGSRFRTLDCSGSYFQLFDYSEISDEDDMSFVEKLTKKHGVAAIPVSVFYGNKRDDKVIRLCFAKSEETISKAAEILCNL